MGEEQNKPYYKECEGIIAPGVFTSKAVHSALDYQHKAGDLFIVTYPKCGTTWMQNIVMLILRNGKPLTDTVDFFVNSPSLEMYGAEAISCMTDAGVIKTHIPLHRMKLSPQAKYIYVARNPKDCLVSLYHHTNDIPIFKFLNGTFDQFFELFMKGQVEGGDYFEHLLSGYERRNYSNVLFITFESMKRNIREEILKIAKFIDEMYEKKLLEEPKILEDIIYYSSFDYMKDNDKQSFGLFMKMISSDANLSKKMPPGLKELSRNIRELNVERGRRGKFVRKGIIGDWKNYLTEEQSERLEEKIRTKTANSDVMNLWKGLAIFRNIQ